MGTKAKIQVTSKLEELGVDKLTPGNLKSVLDLRETIKRNIKKIRASKAISGTQKAKAIKQLNDIRRKIESEYVSTARSAE